jgi:hypothetical protein
MQMDIRYYLVYKELQIQPYIAYTDNELRNILILLVTIDEVYLNL